MSRDDPHFRLRIPPGIKQEIIDAARANNRSANAEIISRLSWSLAREQPRPTVRSTAHANAGTTLDYADFPDCSLIVIGKTRELSPGARKIIELVNLVMGDR